MIHPVPHEEPEPPDLWAAADRRIGKKRMEAMTLSPVMVPPEPESGRHRDIAEYGPHHLYQRVDSYQHYVSHAEFVETLDAVVDRLNDHLRKSDKPYGVVLDTLPHKSRYWIYRLIEQQLVRPPMVVTYDQQATSVLRLCEEVVIFDDIIQSGKQIETSIDGIPLGRKIFLAVPFCKDHIPDLLAYKARQRDGFSPSGKKADIRFLGTQLEPWHSVWFDHSVPDSTSVKDRALIHPKPYSDARTAQAFMAEEARLYAQGGFVPAPPSQARERTIQDVSSAMRERVLGDL